MDKPKAATAAAHKLARLIYTMLTKGEGYTDQGQDYHEALPLTSAPVLGSACRKDGHETRRFRTTRLRPSFYIYHLGGVS